MDIESIDGREQSWMDRLETRKKADSLLFEGDSVEVEI